jgi:hypothetical protein
MTRFDILNNRPPTPRKPKFKIRRDGGLPITDDHPLGADLSQGATGLLYCIRNFPAIQWDRHTTPIPGRRTRKRITHPAPVCALDEVVAPADASWPTRMSP